MRPVSQHRVGRRRSTTWDHISNVAIDLFAAHGFDEVSVDDVAEAAGIARRTLFRYYPSKNALPWGDFDAHLDHMRDLLNDLDPEVPIGEALRTALLAFNSFDEQETARHRQRMRVILETAAAFVAKRLDAKVEDLVPQTVAWTMLGVALSAYEHWLADESVSLAQALGDAFDTVSDGLSALDGKGRRKNSRLDRRS
jgi:TetR/AcrR family transcriptional regulator, regulator of mycofactocin system